MARYGTGQIHAVGAGLFAACASVFAKLAVTSDVVLEMCRGLLYLTTADKQNASASTSHHSSVQQDVWTDFCVPVKSAELIIFYSYDAVKLSELERLEWPL